MPLLAFSVKKETERETQREREREGKRELNSKDQGLSLAPI